MVLGLASYAGHYALLSGYDLSRDEQMAVFDARVFSSGQLVFPLPAAWRGDAPAINLMFMLPVARPVAWISAYLPGNALLRSATGLVADPALTGPLLAALSLVLVWRCACRLWPDEPEPQAIAVLLLALSPQVLMTSMTAYAMPAHLCLNLAWLWLFLRRQVWTDGAALIVGFVATGLHQPLPHPMFVAPFLALMAVRREWRRLAAYVGIYAMIGIFWLGWPLHVHTLVSGPGSQTIGEGTGFMGRLMAMLAGNAQPLPLMAANLLRFADWQALPMIPLLVAGLLVARRDSLAAALVAGMILPILVICAILAYQGHGFGYRYLHGLIGNAALLAGFGWRALASYHERLRPALRAALVLSATVLLPIEAAMAHAFYAPYAEASRRITASGADYVIVSAADAPFATDLAINRPDLSNRPIRLTAEGIADPVSLAKRICHPGTTLALPQPGLTKPIWDYFGVKPERSADARLTRPFAEAGCRIVPLE
jgi:hypothetical protein